MNPAGEGTPVVTAPVASARVRPLTWLLLGVLAAVAGGLPSFSLGANLLVLTIGGALFWIGVRAGARAGRRPWARRSARWWLVPLAGLALVEAVNYALGSTYEHPTLSLLADPWLERYPVRAAAFLGWAGAFWTMVRR